MGRKPKAKADKSEKTFANQAFEFVQRLSGGGAGALSGGRATAAVDGDEPLTAVQSPKFVQSPKATTSREQAEHEQQQEQQVPERAGDEDAGGERLTPAAFICALRSPLSLLILLLVVVLLWRASSPALDSRKLTAQINHMNSTLPAALQQVQELSSKVASLEARLSNEQPHHSSAFFSPPSDHQHSHTCPVCSAHLPTSQPPQHTLSPDPTSVLSTIGPILPLHLIYHTPGMVTDPRSPSPTLLSRIHAFLHRVFHPFSSKVHPRARRTLTDPASLPAAAASFHTAAAAPPPEAPVMWCPSSLWFDVSDRYNATSASASVLELHFRTASGVKLSQLGAISIVTASSSVPLFNSRDSSNDSSSGSAPPSLRVKIHLKLEAVGYYVGTFWIQAGAFELAARSDESAQKAEPQATATEQLARGLAAHTFSLEDSPSVIEYLQSYPVHYPSRFNYTISAIKVQLRSKQPRPFVCAPHVFLHAVRLAEW